MNPNEVEVEVEVEVDIVEEDEDNHRSLLRSVSAPVGGAGYRGKGFVRPNCSTTFWLHCPVCCRRYFKFDSHFECFSRWCEICQDVLPTTAALQHHGKTYHRKNYCMDCNHVYENIRGHRAYEHATTSTAATTGTLPLAGSSSAKPKKTTTRISRAATTTAGTFH